MADVTSKDCKPCPDCLDGEEMVIEDGVAHSWGSKCPTCSGWAVVKLDGAKFTADEWHGIDAAVW